MKGETVVEIERGGFLSPAGAVLVEAEQINVLFFFFERGVEILDRRSEGLCELRACAVDTDLCWGSCLLFQYDEGGLQRKDTLLIVCLGLSLCGHWRHACTHYGRGRVRISVERSVERFDSSSVLCGINGSEVRLRLFRS